MPRKIAIVGSGANGTSIGVDVARAGHDVTLIDQWPAHVEAMRKNGATIAMPEETVVQPVNALHLCEVCTLKEPFDVVLVVTKAYDARWSSQLIEPWLKEDGLLVAVQNGMTAGTVAEVVGPERTLGCVIEISSGLFTPGIVERHSPPARSWFAVGSFHPATKGREGEVAALLSCAGACEIVDDILAAKWMKLVSNCTTLATTACLGKSIVDAESVPGMRAFMLRAGQEALDVGAAVGHERRPILGMSERDVRDSNRLVETMLDRLMEGFILPDTRGVVLQDWEKGRKSELDNLNGHVARTAREAGIAAPACEAVSEIARRIERGELEPGVENLALLNDLAQSYARG
ncbi:MAG: 2-dehydropantoate 2-reductase [Defluviicoccus sp.]|nr:2-dehydropantoate 2-reductase [Defluviicoccus sp.]MDE0275279.1 2-dehydropantoate 2-reductase [Defluviicoccus sp.]